MEHVAHSDFTVRNVYKILLLNMWRDLKRPRTSMARIPTLVGVLLFVGCLSVAAHSLLHMDGRALLSSVQSSPSSDQVPPNEASLPKSSKQVPISLQQPSRSAPSEDSSSNAAQSTETQPNKPVETAVFTIANIVLTTPTLTCAQGQQVLQIETARMGLDGWAQPTSTVRWYWEARFEGGQPSEDDAPLSDIVRTTKVGEDTSSVALGSITQPLVTAPTKSYKYSFRLHSLVPSDVASEWVHVPTKDTAACQ